MRPAMILRLCLVMAMLVAAGAPARGQDQPYRLANAVERSLTAPDGENYRLFIHVPAGKPPPGGFPLLYVLDGEDNFPVVVATAIRMARAGKRSGIGPGIVVGIDSGDLARRSRDYTPRFEGPVVRPGQPGYGLPTGGADAFLDFIEHEVQPALLRDFPIDTARVAILGHSFGGTLVLHALMTHPRLFSTYVAASPSLWLAGGAMMREAERWPGVGRKQLLITVGKKENAQDAVAIARTLAGKGTESTARILIGEDHGSSMLPTIAEAIRLAFGISVALSRDR